MPSLRRISAFACCTRFRSGNTYRSAFTLAELITAIFTLAAFTAAVVPAVASFQRRSAQAASMQNLHQWGAALSLSLADGDDRLPLPGDASHLGELRAWYNRLPPYIGEKTYANLLLQHPEQLRERPLWINPGAPAHEAKSSPVRSAHFFYAMNRSLGSLDSDSFRVGELPHAETTLFMAETNGASPACDLRDIRAYFGSGNPQNDPANSANILFCDGHVELLSRTEFTRAMGNESHAPRVALSP